MAFRSFGVFALTGHHVLRAGGADRGRGLADCMECVHGDRRVLVQTPGPLEVFVWRMCNRHFRRLCAVEEVDTDADGAPMLTRPAAVSAD